MDECCNDKNNNDNEGASCSLNELLRKCKKIIEDGGSPDKTVKAIGMLQDVQKRIASVGIFSKNEQLEDLSTASLELLATEFHLGMAYSLKSSGGSKERRDNLVRSVELHHSFLRRLDEMEVLKDKPEILKSYHRILDLEESNEDPSKINSSSMLTHGQVREAKIARFRLKKGFTDESQRLSSFRERRRRMNIQEDDMLDGYDGETLERSLILVEMATYALVSLEEIESSTKEMDMLEMAVKMEEMRRIQNQYKGTNHNTHDAANHTAPSSQPHISNKPLEVTHVTQDPRTGQLIFKKEQIRSQVFRPGWNQPTMSLAELGDRERAEAIEREKKQKEAENSAKLNPRRYEQLVKDGLEDNADLVDASAKLDREWDDWKDENPRGSGNKMGDRGDRNF